MKIHTKTLYLIWCKDTDDWLRECSTGSSEKSAVLAFGSKVEAQNRAASHYGFKMYQEALKHDWCEVYSTK